MKIDKRNRTWTDCVNCKKINSSYYRTTLKNYKCRVCGYITTLQEVDVSDKYPNNNISVPITSIPVTSTSKLEEVIKWWNPFTWF